MIVAMDTRTAVILVNWRGADDTIECLASLFCADQVPFVIVVDNDSGDGSVDRIAEWANGKNRTPIANSHHVNNAYENIARPIDFEIIGREQLSGGATKPLTIINSGGNWGFAGGNNMGLALALATEGISLFWLLNNDTIVGPETPSSVRSAFDKNPLWGMAGTPIRLYHQPDRHQLVNGMRFSTLTGAGQAIEMGSPVGKPFDSKKIINETDFVCGASIIVTRDLVEEIGMMEDRFFLYYEEIDWAVRSKGKFELGFVEDAVVYHKEGASAGSASQLSSRARSPLSEYHHIRSKMIFCKKHYPMLLPVYFAQNLLILMRRVWRRQPPQISAVFRATFGLPLQSGSKT